MRVFRNLTFIGMASYALLCLLSMATMSLGMVFFLGCLLLEKGAAQFLRELRELLGEPPVRLYFQLSSVFVLVCLMGLVLAQFFPLTYLGQGAEMRWGRDLLKLLYFLYPLWLAVGWRRLTVLQHTRVLQVWLATFGVLSCFGVVQIFTGFAGANPNYLLKGMFHPNLFFGHHLSVASILIFPFFAALDALVAKKPLLPRFWLAGMVVFGLAVLIFSYSRTLWLGLPLGLLVWVALRVPRRWLLPLGVGVILLAVGLGFTEQAQIRFKSTIGVGDRIELWKANWEFFKARPLFGVGLAKGEGLVGPYFASIYPGRVDFFGGHAHSLYLELLACTGILGLLSWLLWFGSLVRRSYGVLREGLGQGVFSFPGGLLAALVVFLVNGLTQVNFWEGKVLHQVMWVCALTLVWRPLQRSWR